MIFASFLAASLCIATAICGDHALAAQNTPYAPPRFQFTYELFRINDNQVKQGGSFTAVISTKISTSDEGKVTLNCEVTNIGVSEDIRAKGKEISLDPFSFEIELNHAGQILKLRTPAANLIKGREDFCAAIVQQSVLTYFWLLPSEFKSDVDSWESLTIDSSIIVGELADLFKRGLQEPARFRFRLADRVSLDNQKCDLMIGERLDKQGNRSSMSVHIFREAETKRVLRAKRIEHLFDATSDKLRMVSVFTAQRL